MRLLEVSHYYPFGLTIDSITQSCLTPGVRENQYTYNGKEWQNEGGFNQYDYGARMYDPAVGRWWTHDLLTEDYSEVSPYVYTLNSPIKYLDPDGNRVWLSVTYTNSEGDEVTERMQYKNYRLYTQNGEVYQFNAEGAELLLTSLESLNDIAVVGRENIDVKDVIDYLTSDESGDHTINVDENLSAEDIKHTPKGDFIRVIKGKDTQIDWNPFLETNTEGDVRPPYVALAHELKHSYDRAKHKMVSSDESNVLYNAGCNDNTGMVVHMDKMEVRAVSFENKVRRGRGLPERESYGGVRILWGRVPKEDK